MRWPSLTELPLPAKGKTGWPWTEESPPLPDTMPDGRPWPKVSIVTPSYNQGQFLEETIRSVLLQGYPNLEYIIIDGGSDDNSVEIIKKYKPWLAYWVSEPDRGQAHAINKGFRRARGELLAWLNSDDLYTKRAISRIIQVFVKQPGADIVYGDCLHIDSRSRKIRYIKGFEFAPLCLLVGNISQPSTFFRKRVLASGFLDENLHWALDYEFWLRLMRKYHFKYLPAVLSMFRLHKESKTLSSRMMMQEEICKVFKEHVNVIQLTPHLKKRLVSLVNWKLAIISWLCGDEKKSYQYLEDVDENIIHSVPFIQEAIFTIVPINEIKDKSDLELAELLDRVIKFYKFASHRERPAVISRFVSQYYITVGIEQRRFSFLIKGIAENSFYFLALLRRHFVVPSSLRGLPPRVKRRIL